MAKDDDLAAIRALEAIEKIQRLDDADAISSFLITHLKDLGFDYVTLWTLPPPGQSPLDGVLLNTRPENYVHHYLENSYVTEDPAVTQISQFNRPFSLTELLDADNLSKKERRIVHEGSEFGINEALIIPIINNNGDVAVLSPCGKYPDLSKRARSVTEMVGIYAHQKLRRMALAKKKEPPIESRLSQRERDVMQWVAHGKTNDEIAALLGVTHSTVRSHIQRIMNKLGAANRTGAAMMALVRGEIRL